MYGALSDLGGNILDEVNISPSRHLREDSFNHLTTLIDTLLACPKVGGPAGARDRGGSAGSHLAHAGHCHLGLHPALGRFPLKARLSERYDLPITVDNDVNLAALGELWFGAGQNVQNMVLVAIGTGIGAGIIIDGALYRGAQ